MNVTIPEHLFPYFEKCGTRKNYAPDEMIILESDRSDMIYLVVAGRVRVYCSAPSGKELTLRILAKGRLIGEDALVPLGEAHVSVAAVNAAVLIACSVEKLFPFIRESEELMREIFRYLTRTNMSLTKHIKRIAIYDSRQKMASFLLEKTAVNDPHRNIFDHTLPYSHEKVSVYLGMNRVTVTRILKEFCQKGYVELGYKKIKVCDPEGIRAEFGENI